MEKFNNLENNMQEVETLNETEKGESGFFQNISLKDDLEKTKGTQEKNKKNIGILSESIEETQKKIRQIMERLGISNPENTDINNSKN